MCLHHVSKAFTSIDVDSTLEIREAVIFPEPSLDIGLVA